MGYRQELMGRQPNDNTTYGPPPIEGLPPVSSEWVPYGDQSGKARARGPHDLGALDVLKDGTIDYAKIVKEQRRAEQESLESAYPEEFSSQQS